MEFGHLISGAVKPSMILSLEVIISFHLLKHRNGTQKSVETNESREPLIARQNLNRKCIKKCSQCHPTVLGIRMALELHTPVLRACEHLCSDAQGCVGAASTRALALRAVVGLLAPVSWHWAARGTATPTERAVAVAMLQGTDKPSVHRNRLPISYKCGVATNCHPSPVNCPLPLGLAFEKKKKILRVTAL